MIADILYCLYLVKDDLLLIPSLMFFHGAILQLSYFYQNKPKITIIDEFRATVFLVMFFAGIFVFAFCVIITPREDPLETEGAWMFFKIITLPMTIVNGSLQLSVWNDFKNHPQRLVLVPQTETNFQETLV